MNWKRWVPLPNARRAALRSSFSRRVRFHPALVRASLSRLSCGPILQPNLTVNYVNGSTDRRRVCGEHSRSQSSRWVTLNDAVLSGVDCVCTHWCWHWQHYHLSSCFLCFYTRFVSIYPDLFDFLKIVFVIWNIIDTASFFMKLFSIFFLPFQPSSSRYHFQSRDIKKQVPIRFQINIKFSTECNFLVPFPIFIE